jgi:hypothetical protein
MPATVAVSPDTPVMNRRKQSILRSILTTAALVALFSLAAPKPVHAFLGVGEDAPEKGLIYPGTITGFAELSPGVPCGGCKILVENVPLGTTTDMNGYYSVSGLPPGLWNLKLSHPSFPAFGTKSFPCGSNHGESGEPRQHLCPPVVLTLAGAVSGKIGLPASSDYDIAVIGIPELGIFTQTNGGGPGYLLSNVAPGWRKVVVTTNTSNASTWVYVQPGQVTMNMNVTVPMVPSLVLK